LRVRASLHSCYMTAALKVARDLKSRFPMLQVKSMMLKSGARRLSLPQLDCCTIGLASSLSIMLETTVVRSPVVVQIGEIIVW
jgi:hypothetical protein